MSSLALTMANGATNGGADSARLSGEERFGIGAAVVAHLALAGALAWHATREPPELAPPERIVVSLASEVSLEATAPNPSDNPAAARAPELGEVTEPVPQVVETTPRPPVERQINETPRRTRETARATPTPTPAPAPTQTQQARGNRLDNFLEGNSNADGNSGQPPAQFGRTERAALASAITRELRPHWAAPSGVDVEQLVSVVAWRLNRDGSLRGTPRCLSQRGVNASNRPQASLHCERAVRAVQLAAPFNLPDQFYSRWDDLEWDFDRRL